MNEREREREEEEEEELKMLAYISIHPRAKKRKKTVFLKQEYGRNKSAL